VGESFYGLDQSGDPHGCILNLRDQRANRTPGCRPTKHCLEWRIADCLGKPVERSGRHGGLRKRLGNRSVKAVIGEPVGDRVLAFGLLDGRQHALLSPGEAGGTHCVDGGELGIR